MLSSNSLKVAAILICICLSFSCASNSGICDLFGHFSDLVGSAHRYASARPVVVLETARIKEVRAIEDPLDERDDMRLAWDKAD